MGLCLEMTHVALYGLFSQHNIIAGMGNGNFVGEDFRRGACLLTKVITADSFLVQFDVVEFLAFLAFFCCSPLEGFAGLQACVVSEWEEESSVDHCMGLGTSVQSFCTSFFSSGWGLIGCFLDADVLGWRSGRA